MYVHLETIYLIFCWKFFTKVCKSTFIFKKKKSEKWKNVKEKKKILKSCTQKIKIKN